MIGRADLVAVSALLLLAFATHGRGAEPENAAPESRPVVWALDSGFCEPETVVWSESKRQMYVSNICGFAANGEDYLSRLGPDGELLEERWVTGLDSPAGMALVGDRLYVADFDKVTVVEETTGDVVGTVPLDAGAANDIAVAADGTIYVSDSARHRVLRWQRGEAAPFPADAAFESANGLHLEDDRLLVGGRYLWSIDLATEVVTRIGPEGLGDIDGIEGDGEAGLVVSVVGGPIWHIPASGEAMVWTAAGVSSTNHLYLPERRLVVVPTGFDGTIVAFGLPD